MYNFEFRTPKTLSEAIELLRDEDALPLSGGQTLVPVLKQRLAAPSQLVSLCGIADLKFVHVQDGVLCIGGATTHAQVAKDATAFPALAALAGGIGDPAVRNRGTIGGSLGNNDPSACYPSAVLATGATIVTNTREIPADQFFQGMFSTALEEGEIVIEVRFPIPEKSNYHKFCQPASRFALTGVFVAKYADHVGVAVTGASSEGVFRWTESEVALQNTFAASAVAAVPQPDSELMIEDLHGTKAYRASLVKTVTQWAVNDAG